MAKYADFLIGDMRTGLFTAKEPWLAPPDAFSVLQNAYLERGVLKRRKGSRLFCEIGSNAVVGLSSIQYAGYHEVIACTTKRVYQLGREGAFADISHEDLFTGDSTNSFWFQEYNGSLYFCNGKDAIYKYTPNHVLPYTVTPMDTGSVTIQSTRLLLSYKNRLLFVGPKIGGVWYDNYLYFTDINTDNVSATNFVKAETDDMPVTAGYIDDEPVVFFTRKPWHIVDTRNSDAPFTWVKRLAAFGATARAGCVETKRGLAVIGATSLYEYDGRNAREYDKFVRGFIEDDIDPQKVVNCFLHRFRTRNYIGLSFTRAGQSEHDRLRFYSLDEENFSDSDLAGLCIYSLKGYWKPLSAKADAQSYPPDSADYGEWEFLGTSDGKVLRINHGRSDKGSNIVAIIKTGQLNPFVKQGRKLNLGWIRFLIAADPTQGFQVKLYKNQEATPFKTFNLWSDAETKNWQTVYADGEIADFITVELTSIYGSYWKGASCELHAIEIGAKPADRITEDQAEGQTETPESITTNWRWYNDTQDLYIQHLESSVWTNRYRFDDFYGEHRLYDDGQDLCLQEQRDGVWTTKHKWEGVTGTYRWQESGTDLLLQVDDGGWQTKWKLEGA